MCVLTRALECVMEYYSALKEMQSSKFDVFRVGLVLGVIFIFLFIPSLPHILDILSCVLYAV